jgi:hypothetical protein
MLDRQASTLSHLSEMQRMAQHPPPIGVIDEHYPVAHARGADLKCLTERRLERPTERRGKERTPPARSGSEAQYQSDRLALRWSGEGWQSG